jgi:hypothetical protein
MTNAEYVKIINLERIRSAIHILDGVAVDEEYSISKKDYAMASLKLREMEKRLVLAGPYPED